MKIETRIDKIGPAPIAQFFKVGIIHPLFDKRWTIGDSLFTAETTVNGDNYESSRVLSRMYPDDLIVKTECIKSVCDAAKKDHPDLEL